MQTQPMAMMMEYKQTLHPWKHATWHSTFQQDIQLWNRRVSTKWMLKQHLMELSQHEMLCVCVYVCVCVWSLVRMVGVIYAYIDTVFGGGEGGGVF